MILESKKKAIFQAQSGYDSKTFLVVILLPIFMVSLHWLLRIWGWWFYTVYI